MCYIINNNTHCNFTVICTSTNSWLMLPFCKHDQAYQDTYKKNTHDRETEVSSRLMLPFCKHDQAYQDTYQKNTHDRETEVSVSLIFSGCSATKYLKSQ